MNVNNLHNNNPLKNREAQSMNTDIPKTIASIIEKVNTSPAQAKDILTKARVSDPKLQLRNDGYYQYDNYFICTGMKPYFEDDINGLQVANKTNIHCAPKLIDVADLPDNRVMIVFSSNDDCKELVPIEQKLDKLSIADRLLIVDNFRKMLSYDYINQGALDSFDGWMINSDNNLFLTDWKNLRYVTDPEEKRSIISEVEKKMQLNKQNNIYVIDKDS